MPDIFDQIHEDQSSSDIFDQIPSLASAQSQTIPVATGAGGQAQLSPEQYRDYQKRLQATPLDVSYHPESTEMQIARGIAQPIAGTAALATHELAGKVGDIAGTGAENSLDQLATQIQQFGQNPQPSVTSGVTGLATGAAALAIPGGPVVTGLNAGSNRILDEIHNEEAGGPVDQNAIAKALVEGGVDTAVNLAMSSGLSSDALLPS